MFFSFFPDGVSEERGTGGVEDRSRRLTRRAQRQEDGYLVSGRGDGRMQDGSDSIVLLLYRTIHNDAKAWVDF